MFECHLHYFLLYIFNTLNTKHRVKSTIILAKGHLSFHPNDWSIIPSIFSTVQNVKCPHKHIMIPLRFLSRTRAPSRLPHFTRNSTYDTAHSRFLISFLLSLFSPIHLGAQVALLYICSSCSFLSHLLHHHLPSPSLSFVLA